MRNDSTFIGIDAHKKYCYVNVQNRDGVVMEARRVETGRESLDEYFSQFDRDGAVAVLESTYNWMFVYEMVKRHVGEVKLANPRQTKAITAAKVKTDKVDAKTLADLLRADLIPEIYVSDKSERAQKDVLRYRYTLISIRTSLKNKIHAFMSRYGFATPYTDMFGKRGVEYIGALEWREPEKSIVEEYLRMIKELDKKVYVIDKLLKERIKETEELQLLMSIPGIGVISAAMIMAEIGVIRRFSSYKNLVSYGGLVPGVSSSAGKTYYTRSKERNKYLQWILIEAAIPATRTSPILLAKYTRIKRRSGDSRKAKMTVARKLGEAVFKVLTMKRPYLEGVTIRKSAPSCPR